MALLFDSLWIKFDQASQNKSLWTKSLRDIIGVECGLEHTMQIAICKKGYGKKTGKKSMTKKCTCTKDLNVIVVNDILLTYSPEIQIRRNWPQICLAAFPVPSGQQVSKVFLFYTLNMK